MNSYAKGGWGYYQEKSSGIKPYVFYYTGFVLF